MLDSAARAGGAVLAGVFGTVARLRPTTKPLHPRGRVGTGTLTRQGTAPRTGVDWIDQPGSDPVVVRLSNAAGMPRNLPDVRGLAVRVPLDTGGFADVLLASTGTRPLARHLLMVSLTDRHDMTTLLPYRSPRGPLLIAAMPDAGADFSFCWATLTGPWHPFATLQVDASTLTEDADPPLRFDPVLNQLPGLSSYGWTARLREPAYTAARTNSPG